MGRATSQLKSLDMTPRQWFEPLGLKAFAGEPEGSRSKARDRTASLKARVLEPELR
jgi:hypothetical protein